MERSSHDRAYSPHTVALGLIVGIVIGILGSQYGWFAPAHELGHMIAVWVVGGQVARIGWDFIEFRNVPMYTPRFRFVIAAGAVGEHLVALVVMIVALLRGKPLLSGIGFGYLAHGMNWAWNLREWEYLRQPFFVFWEISTYLVYILLATVGFTYVSWIVHVACISRSKRSTVPRHSLARYSIG